MASATVLYQDRESRSEGARVEADELWLTLSDLAATTGWELKPEGVCKDEICVPVPAARRSALIREDASGSEFDVTEFARLIEQPFARDEKHGGLVLRPAGLGVEDSLDLSRGARLRAARPGRPGAHSGRASRKQDLPALLGHLVKLPV